MQNSGFFMTGLLRLKLFIPSAINGRGYGNLQGLDMCKGERVMWHLLGLGANEALHVPVINGNNLRIDNINRDSHILVPEMSVSGEMMADNAGKFVQYFNSSMQYI